MAIPGFDGYAETVKRGMGDMEKGQYVILASVGIAFVMAFLYISLMKWCVGLLVWGTIFGIIAGGALLSWNFYEAAQAAQSTDEKTQNEIICYVAGGMTFVFFCIIMFGRERIRIAVEVIKSASRGIYISFLILFLFFIV